MQDHENCDQCDVPKQKTMTGNRVNPVPALLNLFLNMVSISPTDNVSMHACVDLEHVNTCEAVPNSINYNIKYRGQCLETGLLNSSQTNPSIPSDIFQQCYPSMINRWI